MTSEQIDQTDGTAPDDNIVFKSFRQLNAEEVTSWMSSRSGLDGSIATQFFTQDNLHDRLVRALAVEGVLPIKEVLESFEFFERIRKEMRSPNMADLCCGHGLVGILFAVFERCVDRVVLIDAQEPPSHKKTLACIAAVCPWIRDKLSYRTARIDVAPELLEPGTTVVSTHACGKLTDYCLEVAIRLNGKVAVMPCCYPKRACPAPEAVRRSLGHELGFDIDRTYRLEKAGYHVRWTAIPRPITPMNRIIIGRMRKEE